MQLSLTSLPAKWFHAKAQSKVSEFISFFAPWRETAFVLRPSLFGAGTSWPVQGGNLLTDDRIIRSFVYVDLGPMSVVLRHISIGKDCFDGTLRHTGIAVDTSI